MYFKVWADGGHSVWLSGKGTADSGNTNTPTEGMRTIYLNTGGSGLWNQAGAWFWVHAWIGDDFVDLAMEHVEGDIYKVEIDSKYTNIIFVRQDANNHEVGNWNGKWNQTSDLVVSDNVNCYTITGWGGNDGNWSTK